MNDGRTIHSLTVDIEASIECARRALCDALHAVEFRSSDETTMSPSQRRRHTRKAIVDAFAMLEHAQGDLETVRAKLPHPTVYVPANDAGKAGAA